MKNPRPCGFCAFFVHAGGPNPLGECRRWPPGTPGPGSEATFPDVMANAWCGEFAAPPRPRLHWLRTLGS